MTSSDSSPAASAASTSPTVPTPRPTLASRLPQPGTTLPPEQSLDLFLAHVADLGLALYPAQEQALLELWSGKHVILNTPTGSGKSLVALGLHFKGLCEGKVSFYTSPIKALASEKFFALCEELGPERVGMLTGDASINVEAQVVCCTAEVLANLALRRGELLAAPNVVMDEFHYYSDSERGWAWQVPLIALPRTRFLLMSATLGDMSSIAERLSTRSGIEVAWVSRGERPVPLDWEYRETPLHESIEYLLAAGKAPIYVVNFTQRECAELAQALTSAQITTREEREAIRAAIGDYRLDTPYGKEFRRFLGFGVGVHHAGLLPKYRLLVEQLAQRGLLKVICGTDTLGVGVNIPIRTVLFTKLAKYDGQKTTQLAVRDFQQIAGRAGRKGFDDRGSVVAQAPEHVIERRSAERRAGGGKKVKVALKGPAKGEVSWSAETFERLISRAPETLKSRFRVTHAMVIHLLQRDAELDDPAQRNFASLRDLIANSHDDEAGRARHLRFAAVLVRSLARAGILQAKKDTRTDYYWIILAPELQFDFSLLHTLSLFMVDALERFEPESETYGLDLLTLVESVLEDPDVILRKQADRAKQALLAQLKADGVPYEERVERLDEITHPKPLADLLYGLFAGFRGAHPWVGGRDISPKSIGREMFEEGLTFADFVKRYGLQRSEGVVLRYLSQLYKTLDQSVPTQAKTESVWDALGYFRTVIELTDTSLLEEWESLLHPELLRRAAAERERAVEKLWLLELVESPTALSARVRAECHLLVHALAERDWEEATELVAQDPANPWDAERFAAALAPFFEPHGELLAGPAARRHRWTQIRPAGDRAWEVVHTLLAPDGDESWAVYATVDLRRAEAVDAPLLRLAAIRP